MKNHLTQEVANRILGRDGTEVEMGLVAEDNMLQPPPTLALLLADSLTPDASQDLLDEVPDRGFY